MKYIYHHLGLGDHIICNGLVRSIINEFENYLMFVKSHNLSTVRFMYRDIKNLDFLVGDDVYANTYIKENRLTRDDLILAGFYRHPMSKEFDDSFYLQNNLPFNYRWEKFYVERDYQKENILFEKFGVVKNNYVFIHDDKSRGLNINEDLIQNKNLQIVRPIVGITENIFDYCKLMECSVESHFIDSSFRLIYDSLLPQKDLLFYHNTYNGVRRDETKSQSKLQYKEI
jgi:hypothetical protein